MCATTPGLKVNSKYIHQSSINSIRQKHYCNHEETLWIAFMDDTTEIIYLENLLLAIK